MNKSQALKEAVRLFGKDAVVIDDGPRRASNPENRAKAREEMKRLNALCITHELRKQYRKERDHWLSEAYRYRYRVGIHHGFAIGVRGSGDSWQECFNDWNASRTKLAA